MRWVVRVVAVLAALAGLVVLVGWMLPVSHVAQRSVSFEQPPAAVYALISGVERYADWRPDVERIELLEQADGRRRFREHGANGPLTMAVVEAVSPARFVTAIDDADQPFGGTWTFEIEPAGANGSRLTITERGEVYNPVFRFVSRFVLGHTATMDQFIEALRARLARP